MRARGVADLPLRNAEDTSHFGQDPTGLLHRVHQPVAFGQTRARCGPSWMVQIPDLEG